MSSVEGEGLSPQEFAAGVLEDWDELVDGESSQPSEPVVDETGRARDPESGRFVAKQEEPAEDPAEGEEAQTEETEGEEAGEAAAAEEPEEGVVELELDDPELVAFLDKYDGDLGAALKGANEALKMAGRQSSELNELRRLQVELQELKGLTAAALMREPVVPITADMIENDPQTAAELAVKQGNPDALAAAVDSWIAEGEQGAFQAALFMSSLMNDFKMDQLRAELRPTGTPAATQQGPDMVDIEVGKVVQRHPDLPDLLPAIAEVAQERPTLLFAMENGSPAERAQALEDALVIAKSRQGADTSREALRRVHVKVKAETDKAKAEAGVVSAKRGSAATGQPTGVDQFLAAFDARLGLKADQS